jgi:ketosteroid isomerase-like protein
MDNRSSHVRSAIQVEGQPVHRDQLRGMTSRKETSMITNDEQIQAMTTEQTEELLHRFVGAQASADVDALRALLTDDFKLVGPLGFVVPKEQWIAQFSSGALQIESLDWDEIDVRTHGYAQTSIAIGQLTQQAKYAGQPANGRFRVTAIALRHGPHWRLAGAHYSGIAAP